MNSAPIRDRNDSVDDTVERVARERCEPLDLHPDKLVDREAAWPGYVGMAVNGIESWKVLAGG